MNRIITQELELLQPDSKTVGQLSQSYQRVQITEWSITENARGSVQWFQHQLRKYIKDLMYL